MIDTALLLAAGLGTRLAPLSSLRAKAALPVAGEPIVRRQIRWLAAAGVSRLVVNLHHLPATITALVGHGEDLGVAVHYSWERQVLGSAGGPRRALDLLDRERFYIVNADTLTDLDLRALAGDHAAGGALVTMAAVTARPGYNALSVADGRFAGLLPAGAAAPAGAVAAHFIGVQVAERGAFADLPANQPADVVRDAYPRLVATRPDAVRVRLSEASFHDIGTPAEYLRTAATFAAREGRMLDRGRGVVIDAAAQVERTICWNDVEIGAGAEVVGCVATDGVRVPAGLHVRDACLLTAAGRAAGPRDRVVGNLLIVPLTATAG